MISHMESMSGASILRTLIYASIFKAGVKRSRLKSLLISPSSIGETELDKSLKRLLKQRLITMDQDWIFLGEKTADHKTREVESQSKLEYAKRHLQRISWLPTIDGIAVTGSVSILNATRSEDIDLMIVTKRGFLWITRALVSLILFTDGTLRRRFEKKVTNKFCLNLWLDENSLQLPRQSLYVARELAQAEWLVDKNEISVRLWSANTWTRKYLGRGDGRKKPKSKKIRLAALAAFICSPVEFFCFQLQFVRMQPTREIVSSDKAFFHPRDTQAQVLGQYLTLCRRYNVSSLVD